MGDFMPIYVLDDEAGFFGRLTEIYWFTIMFVGYPILAITEWVHWEIYGKGPRRKR